MNLENSIKDCIAKELGKGIVEKVISEKLEECIASSVKDMFGWNGSIKKVIEDKVKGVMIPYLEGYDYSKYITKLDYVLVEVLKNSTLENRTLIGNFKELMSTNEMSREIKLSDIYNEWTKYCAKQVDTTSLEVEDGEYEFLEVSLDVEEISRDWSDFEKIIVTFECAQDEELNVEFELSRWKKSSRTTYSIYHNKNTYIESLRNLKEFDVYMMKLASALPEVEINTRRENDEIEVEANPYD